MLTICALPAQARTTPTSTKSTATASCGGENPVKTGGTPWTCTWDDEFTSSTLDSTHWMVQTTAASGFTEGPVCFENSPNNISVANGVLSLTVRKEAKPFSCASPSGAFTTQYTSGEVMTYSKWSQTYGRFEVRAKFPASTVRGLQSSLWLFPQNYAKFGVWPWSGEIDIAEEYSQYANLAIPYVHYVPAVTDTHVTNDTCVISSNAFHDYVAEWTPTTITISYDGKTCLTDTFKPHAPLTTGEPFNQPFIMALTQALGQGTNAVNASTTQLPATTQVDYVRVWS